MKTNLRCPNAVAELQDYSSSYLQLFVIIQTKLLAKQKLSQLRTALSLQRPVAHFYNLKASI